MSELTNEDRERLQETANKIGGVIRRSVKRNRVENRNSTLRKQEPRRCCTNCTFNNGYGYCHLGGSQEIIKVEESDVCDEHFFRGDKRP